MFDTAQPTFCGKSAARSVIPIDDLPEDFHRPETTIWLFRNAHVVHYPVSGGEELAVIVVLVTGTRSATGTRRPAVVGAAEDARVAEPLQALILQARLEAMGAAHAAGTAAMDARTDRAARRRGDPVLPFLAQGGVMALEDAIVVAEAMRRYPHDVATALKWYQRQRRPRTLRVARASGRNGRIFHLSGPQAAARNLVLRHVPAQRLMARYDWLYGWRTD